MDTFWLCFLVLFNFFIWIASVYAEGQCNHPCLGARNCDFAFIQNRCYYVYKDGLRSWDESKEHCEMHGLQMVKINNENVTRVIIRDLLSNLPDWLRRSRNPAWLGGKALNYNSWSFLGGTPISRPNLDIWSSLYIGWQGRADCGCFAPYSAVTNPDVRYFSISVQGCYKRGNFICRKNNCETPANQNCLVFSEEQKTWFEARSRCTDMEGDLFYLKGDEKLSQFGLGGNSPLYDAIRDASENVHIGMVHREWTWHDDMKIHSTNWEAEEPNNYNQGCISMYGNTGKWDDNDCGTKLLTLCQGDFLTTIIPPTPSPTQLTGTNTSHSSVTSPTTTEPAAVLINSSISTAANNNGNGKASELNFIGQDANTNRIIIIVMGVLLGVFFLLSIALISYILCRRHRANKTETEDVEIIDNNYYEGTVERPVNDDAPGRIMTNNINGNAGDRGIVPEKPKALPSYEDVHLYGNDVTNSLPKNKPVLKPKPKVGPVNGDVYSQVTMVRSTSPISPDSDTTYMNAN